jgi:membrane associated rhomboid family serine protease
MAVTPGAVTCYRHPDRETGLSCSDCGRPICTDCATFAPVGIRCPDHSGRPQGAGRVASRAKRASFEGTGAVVTKVLIGLNVLVFLAQVATGNLGGRTGQVYVDGVLVIGNPAIGLAAGEWWRLVTAMFLHAGLIHLAFNMYALYLFGGPLEEILGRGRFILLYLVSGLAGSAGAILLNPEAATVGASGAVFGIFGAVAVLEQQRVIAGAGALGIILVNLVITFVIPGISIGGHLGGLAGGALATLALSRFGRGHAAYGRLGALGVVAVVAVGVASVAVAYLQVQRYA